MTSVMDSLFTILQYAILILGIYTIAILLAVVFVMFINRKNTTYVKKIKLPFITIEFDEKRTMEKDNEKAKNKTKKKK